MPVVDESCQQGGFRFIISEYQSMRYLRKRALFFQLSPSGWRLKTQYSIFCSYPDRQKTVARSYVVDTTKGDFKLRNGHFGQSLAVQQIPLDVIAEPPYDRTQLVSAKFQGRNITLF
jgi:hypothetical protein